MTRLVVAFGYYFANSPTTTTTTTNNNNNNNKYFLYSFLLLRSSAAYGQRITNKKDIFLPDCLGALEGKQFAVESPPFARPCLIKETITAFC